MSRLSIDRMSILQQNKNGRLSMLLNEDDYDYALELRPDDEYRQAAEALPRLVDFDDIDFSNISTDHTQVAGSLQNNNIRPFSGTTEDETAANTKRNRLSNFDSSMLDLHTSNANHARRSSAYNRNSNILSDWGAVEGDNENDIEMTYTGHTNKRDGYIGAEDPADEDFDFENDDENNTEEAERQYDTTITGMGTSQGMGINFNATSGTSSSENSSFSSRWKRLSKKEFSFRLNLLEKHRKWVERAARRSSIGFHRHHPSSDKEAMDRFLVALAGGVHVRRHQGYRLSEVVRLYSTTGCKLIEWDKPRAKDLHAQRHKQQQQGSGGADSGGSGAGVSGGGAGQHDGTNAIYSTKYDKSAFDCCIAICGCGDDLNAGHDANHLDSADTMNTDNGREDNRYLNFGRAFYNIGYRRRGTFRDLDILAVHPAGIEDPTVVGMLGTECLRRTKDAFNAELTFSVVIRDTTSTQGYSTLDIECETEDMYYLLLRGFRLLQEEAEARRGQQSQQLLMQQQRSSGLSGKSSGEGFDVDSTSDVDIEAGDRNSSSTRTRSHGINDDPHNLRQAQRVEQLSRLWNSVKGYVTSTGIVGGGNAPVLDPISELFAPSSQLDPLRALRVGGGFLPAHSVHKSPSHHTVSSPLNSPDPGPASPLAPPLTTHGNGSAASAGAGATETSRSLPLAQFLGWNSAGTQIWARLKMAGLDVKCVLSWDLKRVILKIRCPAWRLEQMAEQMHLKLKSRDGYLKQFKVSRRDTFVAMGDKGAMFRSSERQQIIDYIIRSKIKDGGAELDENTELGKQIVQRFPLHMYSKLADIRHAWVTFWKRERFGEVPASWSPFTESYAVSYGCIRESVAYFTANLLTQPLDSIAEYFGENVAFYFAYMAFYTRWLVFPSVLGVIVFACQVSENKLDHWLCPLYAVVVMIWACFMLAFWRQKASALAHRWGVLDYEVEETERPQFRGAYTYDESSGEVRKTYSLWKRTGKYFISIPVLASAIVVTLVIMTTVFYSQDQMYEDYLHSRPVDFAPKFPTFGHSSSSSAHVNSTFASAGTYNTTAGAVDEPEKSFSLREINNSDFWAATFFYPSLYGIVVSVLTIVFEFIATWLNDFENHRTQTTYINRLILKVFSFQFVTIFTSLYYYAFFLHDQEGAFYQISVTVFSLMTVGQWWSMFLDIVVPSIYHRALLYRMRSAFANTNRKIYRAREYTDKKQRRAETFKQTRKSLNRSLTAIMSEKLDKRMEYLEQGKSKCWEEALQAKYNNFTDYTNMVIQIGFVLFFSAVFPLCPLIALINNLILIRFNALKICYTRQRPIAQKIGGIGVWEDVLQIMSVGGILTNCALYGFTSNQLKNVVTPTFGKTGMAVLLFAYEHTILLFKYWLHGSIPTVHPSVQRARTRERKSCDRKSMLRKEKLTKHGHRRSVLGDHDDQQDGDGGAGGPGGAKKKPLRAQSSMLGYWFDLSNRAAGGTGADQGGAAVGGGARRSLLDQASDDEQEGTSLLQVHASQSVPFSSAVTADAKSHHHRQSNVSHMSRDLKMDCKDDDDDEGSDVCFGNSELEENDDDDAPPPPDCEEDEGPEFEQYASAGAGVYHHRQQLSMARELLDEESLTEYAPPSPHPPQQRTLQPFAQARSSIAQQEAPMQVQVQQGRRRSDSPQPQSTAARDNSPQRAQAHAAGLARDLSPPRDRSPQRSPHRRSLSPSPVRTPPPSTAVLLQPQLQPQPGLHPGGAISRDEMIGIIYANLQNNMLAQLPAEVQLTAPAMSRRVSFVDSGLPAQQHPVCLEPAPSSHAPRRASYVPAAPTTTTNFSAYQQQEYVESGDEDEDNSEYDDFDENVSDLSQNDDEWAEEYDQEEEGAAQGGGGTSNAKGDLWNMSFTTLDSSKHQGKPHRGGAQQGAKGKYLKTKAPTSASAAGGAMSTTKRGSNVKYAAVRSPQQAQQTRSPTKNVVASGASGGPTRQTRTPAAASAPTSATPTPIPSGVQNVQEMISNWFWPTKKETAAAATTSATKASGGANNKASASASGGKHQHSLNLAPLGKNKTAAASVATPVASERKAPASTPITSPVALQFQEVQSPYAALLTPPVVIAPTKNTPGPSATRLHLQDPRDVSPVRTPRGDTTSKETPSGKKATKRTPQPRGVPAATPPSRIFSPPQITSPFSYTEYTPEPSVGMLSQENASILANLQTQQLHQLLLMQQQQAQSSPFISPAPGGKRKLVVSAGAAAVDGSTLVTSTPTGGGGGGGGGINTSPSRSAFAGSRKRHQQQQVLQVLSGHGSPNPYYPILQTGVSDDSAYAATAQGTPVATRPAPQAEKRRSARTPLPFPAAVSAPPAANTPRRRLSVHNNTGGVAPGGTPAAAGAGGKTVTPGVGAVSSSQLNPFSFAAQKRPERVVYD